MGTESIPSRAVRARNEEMHHFIVATDPLVVEVDNETSDTTYMCVPGALRCSCADHRYRDVVCKHLLSLAIDGNSTVRSAITQHISDEVRDRAERQQTLESELEDVEEDLEVFRAVQNAVPDLRTESNDGQQRDDSFRTMLQSITEDDDS